MAQPPYRVLIVDDDLALRTLLRFALARDERFEVVGEAGDGKEGLALLDETDPEVMLLDLAMPDMDGLEVLDRLGHRQADVAVIVLTSFADPRLEEQARAAGASGYLTKGAAFDRFGDQLTAVLAEVDVPRRTHGP